MDRGTAEGTLLIELGGRSVEYRFARRRRRTLGIMVDAGGLRVAAPLRAPWREIEAFLRDKERWILRKLDEWARTPWGVCTEGGAIRLSWRLVHVEPALADYVVAHEVAHLVELNHSRRYWALLARLYPGWRAARERLELSARTLPVLRGKR